MPPSGTSWRYTKEKFAELIADNRIWFGIDGDARPAYKRFLTEVTETIPATTIWLHGEVGHNDESKKEMRFLFGENLFGTPKPERLIERILSLATEAGDLVLDSFLGSGTTAAVAHKMNRRYIGIEMGDHAATHCLPRLKKVVEGEQGGISESVGWKGGGGFRFMKLGEPVFKDDGTINSAVRFASLSSYLWFLETGSPHASNHFESPLLGISNGTAIILLFNGILGDRRPQAGNVLTHAIWNGILAQLPSHDGPRLIYGEACRLSPQKLRQLNVVFKQIPYDIRIR